MKHDLIALAKSIGFTNAEPVEISQIVCDRKFRIPCEANACGMYGKCWMCPPDVGDVDELIEKLQSYSGGILYQSVFKLEDSFDFEGMQEGGRTQSNRSSALQEELKELGYTDFLHLSKGGCGVCSPCAKAEDLPCRFPDKAIPSLEAYGVNVSATVKSTSMKYINGPDTVTYFGLVLFKEKSLWQS